MRPVIRFPALRQLTGLSRSTVDRLEKALDFPRRVRLGPNSVGWRLDEVQAWIAARPRAMHP